MVPHQESQAVTEQAASFQAVAKAYQDISRESAGQLAAASQAFQKSVADYELADDAASQAMGCAEAARQAAQSAQARLQALSAQADSVRAAALMANSLTEDAMGVQAEPEAGGLLAQALNALRSVSAQAEAELADKEKARQEAILQASRARLEAAAAQLSAQAALVRRTQLVEERLDAANQLNLAGLTQQLYQVRQELAAKLAESQSQRLVLDQTISRYQQMMAEAARHEALAAESKAAMEGLAQQVAAAGAAIVPFATQVTAGQHEAALAREQYQAAAAQAQQADAAQAEKAAVAQQAAAAEAEAKAAAKQEIDALILANQARLAEAANQVEAAKEAYRVAQALAGQAAAAVESHEELLKLFQEDQADLEQALDKARRTEKETGHMLGSVHLAQKAMHTGSPAVLSQAEAALAQTLDRLRELATEKEAALVQCGKDLAEAQVQGETLRQAALAAAAAAGEAERVIRGAEAAQQLLYQENLAAEQKLSQNWDNRLHELRLSVALATEELNAAIDIAAAKGREAAALQARLAAADAAAEEAQAAWAAKRQELDAINAELEAASLQKAVDADKLALTLWEQGEQLRLSARELGLGISRLLSKALALQRSEQTLLNQLSGAALQGREKLTALTQDNRAFLAEALRVRQSLAQALDEYREICGQAGAAEDPAAVQVAETLLEMAEHMADSVQARPAVDYTPDLAQGFSFDAELRPIAQIPGDEAILVQAPATAAEAAALPLFPDSNFQPPLPGSIIGFSPARLAPEPPAAEEAGIVTQGEDADAADISSLIQKQLEREDGAAQAGTEAEAEAEAEIAAAAEPAVVEPATGTAEAEEPDLAAAALEEVRRLAEAAVELRPAPAQAPLSQAEQNPLLARLRAMAAGNYEAIPAPATVPAPEPAAPAEPVAEAPVATVELQPLAEAKLAATPEADTEAVARLVAEIIAELPARATAAEAEPSALEAAPAPAELAETAAAGAGSGPSLVYMENFSLADVPALPVVSPDKFVAPTVNDPLDSAEASHRLAEEISSLKSILAAQEEEARQAEAERSRAEAAAAAQEAARAEAAAAAQAEAARVRAATAAAQVESERIRAAEAAAQAEAEARAKQEEAERRQRQDEEALRLAALAEAAAAQLNGGSSREAPAAPPSPARAQQPEDDDDIESELRRLIFQSGNKQK